MTREGNRQSSTECRYLANSISTLRHLSPGMRIGGLDQGAGTVKNNLTHVDSERLNSLQLNSTQLGSTQLSSICLNLTQIDSTQLSSDPEEPPSG